MKNNDIKEGYTNSAKGKYYSHISNEFTDKSKIIKMFTKHPLAIGTGNEYILRNFLKKYLPKQFSISQGFIFESKNEVSKQCDIVIWDSSFASPIFIDGDFVIIGQKSVHAVIEVKTNITKKEIWNSIENIQSVKNFSPNIIGIIFGFDRGSTIKTVRKHLEEYPENIHENLFPDMIIRLNKFALLRPKIQGDSRKKLYPIIFKGRDYSVPFLLSYLTANFFQYRWKKPNDFFQSILKEFLSEGELNSLECEYSIESPIIIGSKKSS